MRAIKHQFGLGMDYCSPVFSTDDGSALSEWVRDKIFLPSGEASAQNTFEINPHLSLNLQHIFLKRLVADSFHCHTIPQQDQPVTDRHVKQKNDSMEFLWSLHSVTEFYESNWGKTFEKYYREIFACS